MEMKMRKGRKRKEFFIVAMFLLMAGALFAQDSLQTVREDFIGDARIDTLLQLHELQNKKFPVIPGYRIQIYKESGNTALNNALAIGEATW